MLPSKVLVQVMLFKRSDCILLFSHVMHFLFTIASNQLCLKRILNKPCLRLSRALSKKRVQRCLAIRNHCFIIKSPFCSTRCSLRPRSFWPAVYRNLKISIHLFLCVQLDLNITIRINFFKLLFTYLVLKLAKILRSIKVISPTSFVCHLNQLRLELYLHYWARKILRTETVLEGSIAI